MKTSPKLILAALSALALPAFGWAEVTASFGVNFMTADGQEVTTATGFTAEGYAAPATWSNFVGSADGAGDIEVGEDKYYAYWTSRGTWNSGCSTDTDAGKLLYGYLDDVANSGRTKATVTIAGLPADKEYAVALILSGDGNGNADFNNRYSPVWINGETYAYDGTTLLVGDDTADVTYWGNRAKTASDNGEFVEGTNVMFVEGLSGSILSITSAMDNWNVSRLTIAGVQVWITDTDVAAPEAPEDKETISLNFHSGDGAVGDATAGIRNVAGWNDLSGASGEGTSLKLWNGTETVDVEMSYSFASATTWGYKENVTDAFLKGYLDDGEHDGVTGATVTISDVPFDEYSVIVYAATDTESAMFQPVQINGSWYTGSASAYGVGYAIPLLAVETANGYWGASRTATAVYGTNALRVDGLSGDLTIQGGGKSGANRGGIAAVQIINTGTYTEPEPDPEEPTGPVCTDGISASYNSIAEAIEAGCTYIMMTAATTEDVTLPEGYTLSTMGATITGKVTIQKGAILYVINGGTIAGDLTFEDGSFLNVQSGDFSVSGAVNFPTEGIFNLTMNTIPAMGVKVPFITLGTALKDDDVTIGTLKFIVGKEEYTTGYKVVTTESTKSYDVTTTATPSCTLDGTAYGSFEEAIAAASAGDYAGDRKLVLTSATSLASALTIDLGGDDKVLTIDLADNTISCWNPEVTPLITIQRGTVMLETSKPTETTGNMITSTGVTVVVGTETSENPTLIIGENTSVATYAYGDAVSVVKGTIGGAGALSTQGNDTVLTMAADTTLDATQGALTLQNDALLGVPEDGTVNVKVAGDAKAEDVILACDTNGITADKFVVSNESLGVTVGVGQITLVDVTTEEDDPIAEALKAALGDNYGDWNGKDVTNPEVVDIIVGCGATVDENGVATFTYDFNVTDITFDGETVSVTVSLGEGQTFAQLAVVYLDMLDTAEDDQVGPSLASGQQRATTTFTKEAGTQLFKVKVALGNQPY